MPVMPAISSGARVQGLVMYLAGPGKANEHSNPHVVAASSRELFSAGGAGTTMTRAHAYELGHAVDEARVVFGTEVTRRDTKALKAAMERGTTGATAIAEATRDENVWHCSLSLPPDMDELDDATWSQITHDFMQGMGFDTEGDAPARWVAIRHGLTKNGGDHVHIAASRVRDDGSVVALWRPHPERSGNEGDYARAQRVARTLEARYGLEVLSGYEKDIATRGRAHAQDAATKPQLDTEGRVVREPRIAESPSVTLARRVRTAAAAAESEAEFVRLVRADGLVIRSARYDRTDPDAVTGFSIGLPTSEYANRHGQPVMHGGKKLAEDLSLPRLREGWIDDDNARTDARAAWDHADAEFPTGTASGPRPTTAPRTSTAETRDGGGDKTTAASTEQQNAEVSARLREILTPLAHAAATEADYARALRDHRDILARPRYAKGSTTDVVGYSVALHPRLAADTDGKPIWRNASYLGDGVALKDLRKRWPDNDSHRKLAASAWSRTTGRRSTDHRAEQRAADAHADARAWEKATGSIGAQSRAWHSAAADTAAAVGAAARGMDTAQAASLNQLSDSLASAAGYRRPPAGRGVHTHNGARRIAATMLAASRDDTTLLWLAVMKQVMAASKAVSDALAAQGQNRQADALRTAMVGAEKQFAGQHYQPPAAGTIGTAPSRTSATTTQRGQGPDHRRDGFGR